VPGGAAHEEEIEALITAMRAVGYRVQVVFVHCDLQESVRRNEARFARLEEGEDYVPACYAERYHRAWLIEAAHAIRQDLAGQPKLEPPPA
jgi:hypothetical protein